MVELRGSQLSQSPRFSPVAPKAVLGPGGFTGGSIKSASAASNGQSGGAALNQHAKEAAAHARKQVRLCRHAYVATLMSPRSC